MKRHLIFLQVRTDDDDDNSNDAVDKDLLYHALKNIDEEKLI